MSDIKPDDPRLKDLRLDSMMAYLETSGWERLNHPNDRAWVFAGPRDDEGQPFKLMVPRRMEFQDAPLRLADAINLLADLEQQAPDEILQRINGTARGVASAPAQRSIPRWGWQDWLAPLAVLTSVVVCVVSILQGGAYLTFLIGVSLFLVAINSLLLMRLVGKLK